MKNNLFEEILKEELQDKTKLIQKRIRRPKINLQPEFERRLKAQILMNRKEGMSDKVILERLQKIIQFYFD